MQNLIKCQNGEKFILETVYHENLETLVSFHMRFKDIKISNKR